MPDTGRLGHRRDQQDERPAQPRPPRATATAGGASPRPTDAGTDPRRPSRWLWSWRHTRACRGGHVAEWAIRIRAILAPIWFIPLHDRGPAGSMTPVGRHSASGAGLVTSAVIAGVVLLAGGGAWAVGSMLTDDGGSTAASPSTSSSASSSPTDASSPSVSESPSESPSATPSTSPADTTAADDAARAACVGQVKAAERHRQGRRRVRAPLEAAHRRLPRQDAWPAHSRPDPEALCRVQGVRARRREGRGGDDEVLHAPPVPPAPMPPRPCRTTQRSGPARPG